MKNIGTALFLNALFSLFTGMTLMLFPGSIAEYFGSPLINPVRILGIALVLFSLFVLYESYRNEKQLVHVLIVIILDIGWILGSAAVIGFKVWELSPAGYRIIGIVAGIVLFFVVHQSYALAYADTKDEDPTGKTFRFAKAVKGDRSQVWEIISDVGNYHKIAPNIDRVDLVSAEEREVGMQRVCYSGSGSWSETCTIWEPGERYSFVVDTDAADYPYPLQALRATWSIDSLPDEKLQITMRFDFQYERLWQTLLLHPLMSRWFSGVCRELLENWRQKIETQGA